MFLNLSNINVDLAMTKGFNSMCNRLFRIKPVKENYVDQGFFVLLFVRKCMNLYEILVAILVSLWPENTKRMYDIAKMLIVMLTSMFS